MESQKIMNPLEQSDEDDLKFQTKNGTLSVTKTMDSMEKVIKMTQQLILVQKF